MRCFLGGEGGDGNFAQLLLIVGNGQLTQVAEGDVCIPNVLGRVV